MFLDIVQRHVQMSCKQRSTFSRPCHHIIHYNIKYIPCPLAVMSGNVVSNRTLRAINGRLNSVFLRRGQGVTYKTEQLPAAQCSVLYKLCSISNHGIAITELETWIRTKSTRSRQGLICGLSNIKISSRQPH